MQHWTKRLIAGMAVAVAGTASACSGVDMEGETWESAPEGWEAEADESDEAAAGSLDPIDDGSPESASNRDEFLEIGTLEQELHTATRSFDCRITSSNSGCKKTIEAPAGKKIIGVRAACNLEWGTVSNSQLSSVSANTVKVVKKSGSRWLYPDGYCYVGNTKIFSGEKKIQGVNGVSEVVVGCYEHDKNGGDCHIRGTVTLADGVGDPAPPPEDLDCATRCEVEYSRCGSVFCKAKVAKCLVRCAVAAAG